MYILLCLYADEYINQEINAYMALIKAYICVHWPRNQLAVILVDYVPTKTQNCWVLTFKNI